MAESTQSKSAMDRLEEALAKLASNHLHVTEKLDDFLVRLLPLNPMFIIHPPLRHPQPFLHQTHKQLIFPE